jgi:nucleotide-binding universal stress UspA family protein
MTTDSPGTRRIVVGVDGSDASLHALEWAVRQAELTAARIDVVAAWHWPPVWGWGVPLAPPTSPAEDLQKVLDDVLEPVRAQHPGVTIDAHIVESHPAPALVDASRGADLLVVGSRGHGEFSGMLLGSVSEHCVSNAECPVLVLREAKH